MTAEEAKKNKKSRTQEEQKQGHTEEAGVEGAKAVRPPELSDEEKQLLRIRKTQKSKKPEFQRQESWRYKRVHRSWRRPKGIDSKMRLKLGGRPKSVSIGYRSPSLVRGRTGSGHEEVLVHNPEDLTKVTLDKVVRIAHVVGQRKRNNILEQAKTLGLYVVNRGKMVSDVES